MFSLDCDCRKLMCTALHAPGFVHLLRLACQQALGFCAASGKSMHGGYWWQQWYTDKVTLQRSMWCLPVLEYTIGSHWPAGSSQTHV